jgi:hypothetical protein
VGQVLTVVLLSNSYPFLLSNQQVEPAKDWRSDFLEKQSLLVVGLCGVLGRLHSKLGLAQSNNNARLNDSAKHVIKAAGNKVQRWSKGGGAKEKHKRGEQVAAGAHTWASCVTHPHKVTSGLGPPFSSSFFSSFFWRTAQTDYMGKGNQEVYSGN